MGRPPTYLMLATKFAGCNENWCSIPGCNHTEDPACKHGRKKPTKKEKSNAAYVSVASRLHVPDAIDRPVHYFSRRSKLECESIVASLPAHDTALKNLLC